MVATRLTFLRILQVAHPCIFRRARPALGDWQRSGDDDDRGSDGIVAEGVPATGGGGGGARRVKLRGELVLYVSHEAKRHLEYEWVRSIFLNAPRNTRVGW
jgi:hypothetical protein